MIDSLLYDPFWLINLHRLIVTILIIVVGLVFMQAGWHNGRDWLLISLASFILLVAIWFMIGWILTLGLVAYGPLWLLIWYGPIAHPILALTGASVLWLFYLQIGRAWLRRLLL